MSSPIRHLVVGPDEHGVVRHATQIAAACGHELVRLPDIAQALDRDRLEQLRGADVVHVAFTDHLFGASCEAALETFTRLAHRIREAGGALSVTLHDLPQGDDALAVRRRAVYREVIGAARGVVVNSMVELAGVERDASRAHSLRCVPLPVPSFGGGPGRAPGVATDRDVVVLGFVFPDRGYEQVIDALPPECGIRAVGRASVGHEDLPAVLAARARDRGRDWRLTGFLPDAELSAQLWAAGVPVAPNRRVSASASIATWVGHRRRPLVPSTPYTRELAARWPGALRLYDPSDVHGLAAAITDAISDPASTWLDERIVVGPSVGDAACAYRSHLAACAPDRPTMISGRTVLPGNRWDLLPTAPTLGTVAVVIPYYEAQESLDRLLSALTLQTIGPERLEVVVADDGSARAPDLHAADGLRARLVRQERDGFGAARARNLGSAASDSDMIAFLDVDMVPEPPYLEHLLRIPNSSEDGLTVGRRRHASLAGWTGADVRAWLTDAADGPAELGEPAWLRNAYHESADLLRAERRAYRYVISAVLAMRRSLFERMGGFDERFRAYGGEDWEFAHRAWLAGALIAHVPSAVAWHDGPDWGARDDVQRRAVKNTETLALTALLPDRELRGGGQWLPYCTVVVSMAAADASGVLATARTAFAAGVDCGFWLTGPAADDVVLTLTDPRIRVGPPPPDVLARAAVLVDVIGPTDLRGLETLCDLAERLGVVTTPALTLRSTRALARCRGAQHRDIAAAALFGRHERSAPVVDEDPDLARALAHSR